MAAIFLTLLFLLVEVMGVQLVRGQVEQRTPRPTMIDDQFLFEPKCPTDWRKDFRDYIRSFKGVWRKVKPTCYTFTFTRSCFCSPDYLGPFMIKVRNRRIAFVEIVDMNANITGTAIGLQNFKQYDLQTIDQLSREIHKICYRPCILDENNGYDFCTPTYNQEFGFLESLNYNPSAALADGGTSWTITDFALCKESGFESF